MTKDHITWKDDIKSGMLSCLENTCNNLIMPTVLCPWGYSEYLHKCGHVPLDILIQRQLQDCSIKTITKSYKYGNIYPSRDDCIRDDNGDYDYWFLNPVLKVSLYIDFFRGVEPCIMPCHNHNDG